MNGTTIRKLEGQELLDTFFTLANYSFSPSPPLPDPQEWGAWLKDRSGVRYWAVFEDGQPGAGVVYSNFPQNVRGKLLPMGGVWGVASAPEARRKGYVRQAMARSFAAMREEGMPVSCLYPFRESFYQRLGYTSWVYPRNAVFDIANLAPLFKMQFKGRVERCLLPDASEVYLAYLDAMRARVHGMALEEDTHRAKDKNKWCLQVKEDGKVTGIMLYHNREDNEKHQMVFQADRFYYTTLSARYQMLEWIARHMDQIAQVRIHLAPFETPETWLPDLEMKIETDGRAPMGRVIDVAGLAGLPAGPGRLTVRIEDPFCPWNEGLWTLDGAGGSLAVEHAGVNASPDAVLAIQGLSAWVYGAVELEGLDLRGWGQVQPAAQEQLRAILPPVQPYIHEFF